MKDTMLTEVVRLRDALGEIADAAEAAPFKTLVMRAIKDVAVKALEGRRSTGYQELAAEVEQLRADVARMKPVFEAAIQDDADYGPQGEAERKRDRLCRAIDAAKEQT